MYCQALYAECRLSFQKMRGKLTAKVERSVLRGVPMHIPFYNCICFSTPTYLYLENTQTIVCTHQNYLHTSWGKQLATEQKEAVPTPQLYTPGKELHCSLICAACMMTASSSRATHSIRSRQRQQEATASTRRRFAISLCSRGDLLSKFL